MAQAADFVGTWKLLDYAFLYDDGRVERPWGEEVAGYLLYSAEGYMSGNLSAARQSRSVERGRDGTSPRRRDYIAYAGPYTVGEETIIHHVEVSLFPNWLGTAQVRYHTLEGDKLVLRTPPVLSDEGRMAVQLIWQRVRASEVL